MKYKIYNLQIFNYDAFLIHLTCVLKYQSAFSFTLYYKNEEICINVF
jgi:hypothetical protein